MKKSLITFIPFVVAGLVAVGGPSASAQTLEAQLQAANYNPITGVWYDNSINANNATFSFVGATPTLVPGVTPSGASAVSIVGSSGSYGNGTRFSFLSPISGASGYTVFAVCEPTTGLGRNSLTGGSSSGALEYDIYNGPQDYLQEYQSDNGHGNATISTSSFSLIDLAVSSSGASFRLNGASDGNVAGGTFGSPITEVGNNEGGGDYFSGYIAEIDIYSGVLSGAQISAVESQLTTEYLTPTPEPATFAMLAGGFGLLFATRRFGRK